MSKLLQEAKKRKEKKQFKLEEFCFKEQLAFIQDSSRFKVACTSTRAGKTISIAADMLDTCLNNNDVVCLYVTSTFRAARNIIWGDLKKIIQDYEIDAEINESRLSIYFNQTRSEARLGGAKDETEIERYRGLKLKKAWVDEAQLFRPYLKYFINDILTVRLRDLRGSLIVTGTPGAVLGGPFYELTQSKKWSQHHWSAFQNPFMKDLEKTLAEEREVKGITEEDPGYIRETFGKWVEDTNSLVYKFSREKNVFEKLPENEEISYIFGIDIGWRDSDAIAVLGFSHTSKHVYLVDEYIKDKEDITSLVIQIKELQKKYDPVKMVMDAGALGVKIQQEISQRHGLVIEAADKHQKHAYIELLNDDLRTGKLKAYPNSRFEQDCFLESWDRSAKLVAQGKLKISDTYHSDINAAVLYGWRFARHFFSEPAEVKPKVDRNSAAWAAQHEQRLMDQFQADLDGHEDVVSQSELEALFQSDE